MEVRYPEDVFTPRTIVTPDMFERRNEPDLEGLPGLQDSLQDALRERGGQVLLYGDTGVGKSSLLKYAAEDEVLDYVLVECSTGMSYDDMLEAAIRQMVDVKEISRTVKVSGSVEVTAEGGVPWITKLSGKFKGETGKDKTFEVRDKAALDVLTEAMDKADKWLIVLDNFQNIKDPAVRERVAQGMEILSDRAGRSEGRDFKFVVIGIASDAATLLGDSRSYGRRTTELGVPRMPDDEIAEILRRGFQILDINVEDSLVEHLVFYSDGFPYFAHLLGLEIARATRRAGEDTVTPVSLDVALKRAAKAVSSSYAERIRLAYEAGGDVQPRRRILGLLAKSPERVWTATEVVDLWEAAYSESRPGLHSSLGKLAEEKYGKILVRRGTKRRYVFAFSDPHLRPYLRITLAEEEKDAASYADLLKLAAGLRILADETASTLRRWRSYESKSPADEGTKQNSEPGSGPNEELSIREEDLE
ncbi:AAA family ATPase [Arthrobacter sp. NPDC056493]|uniref:AAA family ATPase n=1 Tax=Arthrobacter sp. NPDC056493 TaxID=3345839 RepID=UPI00366EC10C